MYILGHLLTGCQFPEAVSQSAMGMPVEIYKIIWKAVQMNRFYVRGDMFILVTIRRKHN